MNLRTEVAVVGSGAGGSVVASRLAANGAGVVVLERGPWLRERELGDTAPAQLAQLYRDGGAQTSHETEMTVLQGCCVGGSTVLTNATCARMPEAVRQQFAGFGFDLAEERLDAAYRRIEEVLDLAPPTPRTEPPRTPLADALRSLGHESEVLRQARRRCPGCAACNAGCRFGRKLDATLTWLPLAQRHDARVMPDVAVRRILHRRGHVRALVCHDLARRAEFLVEAERFVLAGGAVNTPELLLRSGIHRRRAGRRTSFNASVTVLGEFAAPRPDAHDDDPLLQVAAPGFVVEQLRYPPSTPGSTPSAGFPGHVVALSVLVPTAPTGEVSLGRGHRVLPRVFDHAEIRFVLANAERQAFGDGLTLAASALFAAGAAQVHLPLVSLPIARSPRDLDDLPLRLRDQRDLVRLGSCHPQGGAAAGGDVERDVVAPDFRVHGFDNLFVVDASVFPVGVRVHPMLSVMALADLAAESVSAVAARSGLRTPPRHGSSC
ncbi:MAG: GMC family oxidoreductase [Planctomycetes bacterium]|nr:GMC family oxidoreductase [Planctomycetota bacterium]